MKSSLPLPLLFCLCAASVAAGPYDDLAKELSQPLASSDVTVAVAEFESDRDDETVRFIAAEITDAFVRGGVTVVERANVDIIAEELQFQLSGAVDEEEVTEIGRALGAEYLVFGTIRGITRPGYRNRGLRIQAQLVEVARGAVVSSTSIDVEESDMSSPYRRREVRGAAQYPDLIDIKAGGSVFDLEYRSAGGDLPDELDGFSLDIGIDFLAQNSGFFTEGWEILYGWEQHDPDGADLTVHRLSVAKIFLARIPLWRYLDGLPFLTHIFLGIGAGGDLSLAARGDETSGGFGLKGEGLAGWSMGLSDGINLLVEYRYTPRFLNFGVSGMGSEELDSLNVYRQRGHQLMAGISFQP